MNTQLISQQDSLFVKLGKKKFPVSSYQDASDKWVAYRDQTCAGVSEIGNGVHIYNTFNKVVAHVSYNGRIWIN